MKAADTVKLAVAGVVAVAAVVLVVRFLAQEDPDDPRNAVTLWICVAEEEPFDFSIPVRSLISHGVDAEPVTCPNCDSDEVQLARVCPECEGHYPTGIHGSTPETCLRCGAKLPGGDIDSFHAGLH